MLIDLDLDTYSAAVAAMEVCKDFTQDKELVWKYTRAIANMRREFKVALSRADEADCISMLQNNGDLSELL